MTKDEVQKELQQLRATERHLIELMDGGSQEETELLMAKYRRTQMRRRALEETPLWSLAPNPS